MSKQTLIPVGPYHPLQEEPELFKLYCDGEIVKDVKWETGYNHRGIEKLAEKKSYDEVFFLVERICGICSTSHPFAFANSVEEIVGVEITNRAKYIRTIIGELERIHSHLLWVGLAECIQHASRRRPILKANQGRAGIVFSHWADLRIRRDLRDSQEMVRRSTEILRLIGPLALPINRGREIVDDL